MLAWEPGERLVFTWRQGNWPPGESTEVEVRFEGAAGGTRVTVEHRGWDGAPSAGAGTADGYGSAWGELLGFFAGGC